MDLFSWKHFKICLESLQKPWNFDWNLIEIIDWSGKNWYLSMSSYLTHKFGLSLHLFMLSFMYFNRVLKISPQGSFAFFIKIIPRFNNITIVSNIVSNFVTLLPVTLFHIFWLSFWMRVCYYWCGEMQLIVFRLGSYPATFLNSYPF